jgi:hypothetical protein
VRRDEGSGERVAWLGWGEGKGKGVQQLTCYQFALTLTAQATALVPRGHAALRDQIERATASVPLNTAIARGSLLESGAAIDLIQARGLATAAECEQARALRTRVGQMLNGLIRAMERRAGRRVH